MKFCPGRLPGVNHLFPDDHLFIWLSTRVEYIYHTKSTCRQRDNASIGKIKAIFASTYLISDGVANSSTWFYHFLYDRKVPCKFTDWKIFWL